LAKSEIAKICQFFMRLAIKVGHPPITSQYLAFAKFFHQTNHAVGLWEKKEMEAWSSSEFHVVGKNLLGL
jgi:hypothetical protein